MPKFVTEKPENVFMNETPDSWEYYVHDEKPLKDAYYLRRPYDPINFKITFPDLLHKQWSTVTEFQYVLFSLDKQNFDLSVVRENQRIITRIFLNAQPVVIGNSTNRFYDVKISPEGYLTLNPPAENSMPYYLNFKFASKYNIDGVQAIRLGIVGQNVFISNPRREFSIKFQKDKIVFVEQPVTEKPKEMKASSDWWIPIYVIGITVPSAIVLIVFIFCIWYYLCRTPTEKNVPPANPENDPTKKEAKKNEKKEKEDESKSKTMKKSRK
uniref:Allorecognition 2 n=1 Tax=Panagrolaimus sp. JU765 TaxID=591449 RepID=A0AC34R3F3_9BILA